MVKQQLPGDGLGIGNAAIGNQGQKGPAAQIVVFGVQLLGAQQILRGLRCGIVALRNFTRQIIASETVALRIIEGLVKGILTDCATGRKGKGRYRDQKM